MICFDEIHKYPNWSTELKSIYDTFPKLIIVASGSSALEIYKGSHDLSRRAVVYKMFGMSFREFIEIELGINLKSAGLENIINNHQHIADGITTAVEKKGKKFLLFLRAILSMDTILISGNIRTESFFTSPSNRTSTQPLKAISLPSIPH
jgi:predicted AAA+ superfamily ATPase